MALTDHDSTQDVSRIDDADPLLQFVNSLDHSSNPDSVIVAAQLSGTFLQGPQIGQAHERTIFCYRRNLFHVRGTIIPKQEFSRAQNVGVRVRLTATESINGNEVAIITVPKTNKDAATSSGSTTPAPNDVDIKIQGGSTAPIAFNWPRLQFRFATAKGGRRKEKGPEQHFRLHIRIFTLSQDGSEGLLSEKLSTSIIVRGRSPSNFPSATKPSQANPIQLASDPQHEPTRQNVTEDNVTPVWNLGYIEIETSTPPHTFNKDGLASNNDALIFDIGTTEPGTDSRNINHSEFPADDFYISQDLNFEDTGFLSLVMPDRFLGGHGESLEPLRHSTLIPPTASIVGSYTQLEDVSLEQETWINDEMIQPSPETTKKSFSYEYVPLSLNDRTPPVQAVYQPHGVHHKVTLPKTLQGSNKRYFGEFSD
ncbi:Fc.00g072050.m01.CDS01 [Cosmosporella sp. VM-42]